VATGRVGHQVLAEHPVSAGGSVPAEVADGSRQMHRLHDAASVLRSHPAYAAPRARSETVLALLRSGRYSLPSADRG
jgi:hypothetical protein